MCALTAGFQRQVDRANRRGDTLGALLHTFLAFGSDALRNSPYLPGNDVQPMQCDPSSVYPGRRQERPTGVNQPDPFQVLGLDPITATEEDVKRIQRGAAKMWHEDTGQKNPQAQARLAEINAAAVACLEAIRARAAG